MKVIILSAGQGRRLLPLTAATPKAALPVAQQPVLGWQLQEIAQCEVDEVVVMTGFAAGKIERITDRFNAGATGPRVRTAYNPFFAACDNLGTCWLARHEMDEPFVIINGDTLFEAEILRRLLASPAAAPITLVTDSKPEYDADDMKVIVDAGRLHRVGKALTLADVNAESIGMMRFSGSGPEVFAGKLDELMRQESGLGRWYLSAIDELAAEVPVAVCPIDGLSWCEIDERSDLQNAEQVVLNWPRLAPLAAQSL